MEAYKSYEKKGLSHSHICRFFVEGALLLWGLQIAVMIITMVYLSMQPESAIEVTDTGYAYRFETILGYAQCGYENVPAKSQMVSSKVFCMAFLALSGLTKNIPILMVLVYLRRVLKVIRSSHSPFVRETVEYTGKIGRILILTGIFGELVFQMGLGLVAFRVPYAMNPIEWGWILSGIIVLLVNDILRWGCELQEFSDETL